MVNNNLGMEDRLKLLDEIYAAGCRIVSFTGGEPLLIPYLPELMIKAKKLGMWVQYTTNGTFLPKRGEEIKRANPDMIQVSIDGNKFTHEKLRGEGSFEPGMKALDIVKKNNWRCLLVSVISKYTSFESLTFVLAKALEIGAFVSFQPICDCPSLELSEEQLASFIDFLKKIKKTRNEGQFLEVLDKYSVSFVYKEIFNHQRKFYNPMDQSMVMLNHLYKYPKVNDVPCTGGRLFGRIMPNGQLISCYAAIDNNDLANACKVGFKKAWQNIKIHKGKELHHHRLELNLIYSFSVFTLISVFYYHLLNFRRNLKVE